MSRPSALAISPALLLALGLAPTLGGCERSPAPTPTVATPSEVPADPPAEPPLPPDPPALPDPAPAFLLGLTPDPSLRLTVDPNGYTLALLGDDGEVRASVRGEGARGDVHAEARREGEDVVVSVRADSGDFVDFIDDGGTLVGRARLPAEVTRPPLRAPESAVVARAGWGSRFDGYGQRGALRGVEPARRGMDTPVALHRDGGRDGGGAPLAEFHDPEGCIALAVIETEDTLLAAQHCPRRRGVVLVALRTDPSSATPSGPGAPETELRWVARPAPQTFESVGSSRVALEVEDQRIRVWAEESGSRYVATVDTASGRLLSRTLELAPEAPSRVGS